MLPAWKAHTELVYQHPLLLLARTLLFPHNHWIPPVSYIDTIFILFSSYNYESNAHKKFRQRETEKETWRAILMERLPWDCFCELWDIIMVKGQWGWAILTKKINVSFTLLVDDPNENALQYCPSNTKRKKFKKKMVKVNISLEIFHYHPSFTNQNFISALNFWSVNQNQVVEWQLQSMRRRFLFYVRPTKSSGKEEKYKETMLRKMASGWWVIDEVVDKIYRLYMRNWQMRMKMCLRTTWQAIGIDLEIAGVALTKARSMPSQLTSPASLCSMCPLCFAFAYSDHYGIEIGIGIGIGIQSSSSTFLPLQTITSPYLPHVHLPNRQNYPIYVCLHF